VLSVNNKKRFVIIILSVAVILLAITLACFSCSGNLGQRNDTASDSSQAEESEAAKPALPSAEYDQRKIPLGPDEQEMHAEPEIPKTSEEGGTSGNAGTRENPDTPDAPAEPDVSLIATINNIAEIALEYPELSGRLDSVASRFNCAAVSLVAFDSELGNFYVYQYGYANRATRRPIDVDTKLRVASLSKLPTVICAMVLVDMGLVDLDADISDYLGYKVENKRFPNTPITSRMLMQHTSSIYDSDAFLTSRYANSSASTQHLLSTGTQYRGREPGSRHEYSNFGYSVLGAICEVVSGKSLDTLAREVLFDPLGIDAAYVPGKLQDTENIAAIYDERHALTRSVQAQLSVRESSVLGYDNHLAQGNLTISALDYAKIIAMLQNDGRLDDARILSPESASAIHDANINASPYMQGLAVRFQQGAFMPDEGSYWHTGSGHGTFAQFIYEVGDTSRGVVVITKGANTGRAPNGMVNVCTELSAIVWEFLASRPNIDTEDV